ncbi:MAG: MoaD/ThiS family protein [Candidatus Methanodesulfokora sp.]
MDVKGASCKLSDMLSHLSDLKKVIEEFGQENFTILLNGRNIRTLSGLETSVLDGDVIDIFPPAGGGRPFLR